MDSELSCRRWVVQGLVQGVGFRWFVLDRAQSLGVRGWTRNLADGSVEVVGLASRATLGQLAALLRHGPPGARIEQVLEADVPHEVVETKSFIIKH